MDRPNAATLEAAAHALGMEADEIHESPDDEAGYTEDQLYEVAEWLRSMLPVEPTRE